MVLLYDILQILRLPEDNGRLVSTIVMSERYGVTPALSNRALLGQPLSVIALRKKASAAAL